jgi:hypothetical protein
MVQFNKTSKKKQDKIRFSLLNLMSACLYLCLLYLAGYWYHISLFFRQAALCLLNYKTSAYLYDVFLPV